MPNLMKYIEFRWKFEQYLHKYNLVVVGSLDISVCVCVSVCVSVHEAEGGNTMKLTSL